jgi:hypothetical protein
LRTQQGYDWGFFVFLIDTLNDPSPNNFLNDVPGGFATFNGPYTHLTYDTGTWGPTRMHVIFAHEMGHIFGADDEYAGENTCAVGETWGYLQVPNTSCNNGGDTSDLSIMGEVDDLPTIDLSVSARGAIGWRNPAVENGFLVVDVVRTSNVSLSPYSPDPSPGNQPTYSGLGWNVPYPPGAGHQPVSISTTKDVEWQVDGGPMPSASPADGAFNEEHEPFSFTAGLTPGPLPDGVYTFDMQAINQFGHTSVLATDVLNIQYDPVTDTDGDGCSDYNELGPTQGQGGLRDPFNPYDVWDPAPTIGSTAHSIGVADIIAVVRKYASTDPNFDRTPLGPNTWNLGPGSGTVTVADILLAVKQFPISWNCS